MKQDILYFEASGFREMAPLEAIVREISDVIIEKKSAKLMVDISKLSGHLSMLDAIHLVTRTFPEVKKMRILKKAAIVDNERFSRQYDFFETVARNRGYNLMVFDNVEEAVDWLEVERL